MLFRVHDAAMAAVGTSCMSMQCRNSLATISRRYVKLLALHNSSQLGNTESTHDGIQ